MNAFNYKIKCIDPEGLSSMEQFTLPQILYKQAERFGSQKIAIREKAYGIWQTLHWKAYFRYTKHMALGLIALGIERGKTVGLILDNGPEWLFGELGTHAAGAVALPLFASEPADLLVRELGHAQATYVFTQNQMQVDKLLAHREELSHVKQIIYVDPTGLQFYRDDPWLISFKQLLELGEDLDNEQPDLFIKELWEGKPEDMALMLQTTGAAGSPEPVMLSHADFTNMASKWLETEPIDIQTNWVSMSPMAWIVEQMWAVGIALCGGLTTNFPERPETLLENFIDIGPTVIITSADFWEDLASQIFIKMADSGRFNRFLFDITLKTGKHIAALESENKTLSVGLKLKARLLKKVLSRPLLQRIGCRQLLAAYTGGHPVNPDVIQFFRSLGLNLKNFHGLMET